jgi:hypothetical protein
MLSAERTRLAAVPLADAPDVVAFLERMSIGTLTDDRVSSFPGRNDIWAGVTSVGVPVFVKRVNGEEADVRRRLDRMAVMAGALQDHPVVRTPRCLGIDLGGGLAAFELLEEAVTAAELIAESEFGEDVAFEAGAMVGALHRLAPPDLLAEDTSDPPLPPTGGLDAIPLQLFFASSGAELDVWRIIHNDRTLVDATKRLREWERQSVRTVVHGDLRLDQFLRHNGEIHLADWEECRVADPARDIGAFVGELLYRSVLGMVSSKHTGDRELTEDDVVANGVREFELLVPLIAAFWDAYRQARPAAVADEQLAVRAVAFAGWHMFDRAWASGIFRPRLGPLERAAVGVGRTALINPTALIATMGLGGGS